VPYYLTFNINPDLIPTSTSSLKDLLLHLQLLISTDSNRFSYLNPNNDKKYKYALGVDIGENSITISVLDLQMDLENPTPNFVITKHEVIATRYSGELPSEMKTAIEKKDDNKVGELQIQKYEEEQLREPILRNILLDQLARCCRQLQELNQNKVSTENENSKTNYSEFIVFIGDYTSNKGGNFCISSYKCFEKNF